MGTKAIRKQGNDIVKSNEQWDGMQEIIVWADGHLTLVGAYAYRLYYYLWKFRNHCPRGYRIAQYPQWQEDTRIPLGDLTSLLRNAEPTDNVVPVIREAMASIFTLKNTEITKKNMPLNSSIPIRLRLAKDDPRLAPLDKLPLIVKEEDEELPF